MQLCLHIQIMSLTITLQIGAFFDLPPRSASVMLDVGHSLGQIMVTVARMTNGVGLSERSDKKTPLKGIDYQCGRQNQTCRQHFAAIHIYRLTKESIKQGRKWGNSLVSAGHTFLYTHSIGKHLYLRLYYLTHLLPPPLLLKFPFLARFHTSNYP